MIVIAVDLKKSKTPEDKKVACVECISQQQKSSDNIANQNESGKNSVNIAD